MPPRTQVLTRSQMAEITNTINAAIKPLIDEMYDLKTIQAGHSQTLYGVDRKNGITAEVEELKIWRGKWGARTLFYSMATGFIVGAILFVVNLLQHGWK